MLLLLQGSDAPSSPVLGLVLIMAVVGAVADFRYKRAGGKRPTVKDRWLFGTPVFLVAGAIAVLDYRGENPAILGAASFDLSVLLFALWELGRWRMRRKYPLQPKAQVVAGGK